MINAEEEEEEKESAAPPPFTLTFERRELKCSSADDRINDFCCVKMGDTGEEGDAADENDEDEDEEGRLVMIPAKAFSVVCPDGK